MLFGGGDASRFTASLLNAFVTVASISPAMFAAQDFDDEPLCL